jgi:hypothetical protein
LSSRRVGRWYLVFLFAASCGTSKPSNDSLSTRSGALSLGGLSATNLDLQVSGNSCWANGAQTYYQVKNNDAAAVTLSDISIKYWINDTTGSPVVPHVWYGGCVTDAGGTCVHPVANVTASATPFTACGPDANDQANWEVTITTTDTATISPGFTWSNLQTGVNLASYASFSPGSATWYSACGTGQPFHSDPHESVYVKGQLVTSLGITPPDCRAPHGSQTIATYSMPPTSPQVGSLAKDTVLTLALSLPLRNLAALQAQVDAATDPTSPTYRQWLTPADLEASYLPSTDQFSALTAWAALQGLQVSSQPTHMVAGLTGTVAQIEKALFVNMITGRRADGTIYYTPDRQPTLDFATQVLGISGIDNFVPARVAATASGGRAPTPPGGFQSNDFRDGYLGATSSCAALTGAGQTIGVFTFNTGFNQGDIQAYINNTHLTGVPTPTIDVAGTPNGATPTPLASDDGGGGLEASMDIEMAIAMAPGAQVVVFEGNNVDLILEAMVNQPNIAQLTSSWFLPTSATTPQLHTLMAAQGQAFFEASLDFGSYAIASAAPPKGSSCNAAPLGPNVTFDMPYITIVGGTELTLSAGTYIGESAWVGSGGGVMPAVPFPAWQKGANPANLNLSATSRNAPDVSMPSTAIYIVYSTCDGVGLPGIGGAVAPALCTGHVQCTVEPDGKGGTLSIYTGCKGGETRTVTTSGGTSASTPLWAGFMALANQRNQAQGKIGFPNPAIYGIGRGASYGTSFNDVKDMTASGAACDGTQYSAVTGYDQTTGWGSPRCGLVDQLSPQVHQPSPPQITLSGNNTMDASAPVELCGSGSGFTSGNTVTLTMTNVPDVSDATRAPITLGTFTVAADGTFSFDISAFSMPNEVVCSDRQRFDHVTVTATDPAQEIASGTFSADSFCSNALQPGAFGDGCH